MQYDPCRPKYPLKGWQRLGSSLCLWISKQYDWLSMRHTDLCNRICTQTAGEIFTAVPPQKERFAGFHAPEIPFSLCLYAFLNEASKHLFAHCSYNFSILLRGGPRSNRIRHTGVQRPQDVWKYTRFATYTAACCEELEWAVSQRDRDTSVFKLWTWRSTHHVRLLLVRQTN